MLADLNLEVIEDEVEIKDKYRDFENNDFLDDREGAVDEVDEVEVLDELDMVEFMIVRMVLEEIDDNDTIIDFGLNAYIEVDEAELVLLVDQNEKLSLDDEVEAIYIDAMLHIIDEDEVEVVVLVGIVLDEVDANEQ